MSRSARIRWRLRVLYRRRIKPCFKCFICGFVDCHTCIHEDPYEQYHRMVKDLMRELKIKS